MLAAHDMSAHAAATAATLKRLGSPLVDAIHDAEAVVQHAPGAKPGPTSPKAEAGAATSPDAEPTAELIQTHDKLAHAAAAAGAFLNRGELVADAVRDAELAMDSPTTVDSHSLAGKTSD